MTDLDGKILGGGAIKTLLKEGDVYIDVNDLVTVLAGISFDIKLRGVSLGEPLVEEHASAVANLGLELARLQDFDTAPDLFEE